MESKSFLKIRKLNTPNIICEMIIIPDVIKIDKNINLLFEFNNFSVRSNKDDMDETNKALTR
jgi:hypothetical protein